MSSRHLAHLTAVPWVTGLIIVLGLPAPGHAQSSMPSSDTVGAPACYGFAFSAWSPALDWTAAGHPPRGEVNSADVAPGGRSWAVDAARGDSLLLLFPPWWPAGVTVAFPHPPLTAGDTVAGRAVALIADGRRRAPSARVRAWVVRCGR